MISFNKTIIDHLKTLVIFIIILFHTVTVSSQDAVSSQATAPNQVAAPNQKADSDKTTLPFFNANYDAVINGFAVKAKREYKPLDNGLLELNFTASSRLASLSETAQFSWCQQIIQPLSFSAIRNIMGVKKASQLDFNHSDKSLTRTIQKQDEDLAYIENSLDRLSFQLQLQQDLLLNKHDITYNIVHRNSIKKNQFEVIGEEIISTKAGDFKTLKIKVVRESASRVTFIWVAPDWQYLFVRLIQLKNDEEQFSIELTDAIVDNQTVTGLKL